MVYDTILLNCCPEILLCSPNPHRDLPNPSKYCDSHHWALLDHSKEATKVFAPVVMIDRWCIVVLIPLWLSENEKGQMDGQHRCNHKEWHSLWGCNFLLFNLTLIVMFWAMPPPLIEPLCHRAPLFCLVVTLACTLFYPSHFLSIWRVTGVLSCLPLSLRHHLLVVMSHHFDLPSLIVPPHQCPAPHQAAFLLHHHTNAPLCFGWLLHWLALCSSPLITPPPGRWQRSYRRASFASQHTILSK